MAGLRANPSSDIRALERQARKIADRLQVSEKQLDFCREFLVDFNTKGASKRAGFSVNHGYKLLDDKKVVECIKELQGLQQAYKGIDANSLSGQMALYATIDRTTFFNNDWTLKNIDQLTPSQRSCITGVHRKYDKNGNLELKISFADKMRANENLAKFFALYDAPKENLDMFDDMSEDEIEYWLKTHESE